MRNLLALIGLAVVVFLGAGYYLGWYKLDTSTGLNGKQHISFEVDTKKIAADSKDGLEKAKDKAGDLVDNLKKDQSEGTSQPTGPHLPSPSGLFAPAKTTNER
jgi:hypothetical protein